MVWCTCTKRSWSFRLQRFAEYRGFDHRQGVPSSDLIEAMANPGAGPASIGHDTGRRFPPRYQSWRLETMY